jgi:hypothetical protein
LKKNIKEQGIKKTKNKIEKKQMQTLDYPFNRKRGLAIMDDSTCFFFEAAFPLQLYNLKTCKLANLPPVSPRG